MRDKFYAIGSKDSTDKRVIAGKKYILETDDFSKDVYDLSGNYLFTSRTDNFENYERID